MRIDKFLKVSRILKRRSVANSACDGDRVFVFDKAVKPSHQLKIGDKVRVEFGTGALTFIILKLDERASKEDAASLYEICN